MSQRQTPARTGGPGSARPRRPVRHSSAAFVVAAVLGAAIWAGWLGWDRTASYDLITGTVQDPYVTLQVLGCALTVGLAVAVLAARRRPLTGAGGVALGFWGPWTVDAATQDDSGCSRWARCSWRSDWLWERRWLPASGSELERRCGRRGADEVSPRVDAGAVTGEEPQVACSAAPCRGSAQRPITHRWPVSDRQWERAASK